MRGSDGMQESLFTVAKLEDFVPADNRCANPAAGQRSAGPAERAVQPDLRRQRSRLYRPREAAARHARAGAVQVVAETASSRINSTAGLEVAVQ